MHFVNTTVTATLKVCKYLTPGATPWPARSSTFLGTFGNAVDGGYGLHHFERPDHRDRGHERRLQDRHVRRCDRGWVPNRVRAASCSRSARNRDVTELLDVPYVAADGNPAGQDDNQTITSGTASTRCQLHQPGPTASSRSARRCSSTTRTASTTRTSTTSPSSTSRSTARPPARSRTSRSRPVTARCRRSSYRPGSTRSGEPRQDDVGGKRSRWLRVLVVTATGPTGDNRVVGSAGNPVTVNVPYFADPANGGETLVTVTNRVLRAQVKVCKVVEPGSLTRSGRHVGTTAPQPQALTTATPNQTAMNGTCTGLIAPGDPNQSAGWQSSTRPAPDRPRSRRRSSPGPDSG